MTPRDAHRLAQLQRQALPQSALSRLGDRYLREFWRFCAASAQERIFLSRDADSVIVAAAMISLSPNDIGRRLLLRTSLAFNAWKIFLQMLAGGEKAVIPGTELVLLFTDETRRGKGVGGALLASAEASIAAEGLPELYVRTFDDPAHPAYRFYQRSGYALIRSFKAHGQPFALLRKPIAAEADPDQTKRGSDIAMARASPP